MSYSLGGPSNESGSIPIRLATLRNNISPYAGQSQRDVNFDQLFKFLNIFDLHGSPVSREPVGIVALYCLCVL